MSRLLFPSPADHLVLYSHSWKANCQCTAGLDKSITNIRKKSVNGFCFAGFIMTSRFLLRRSILQPVFTHAGGTVMRCCCCLSGVYHLVLTHAYTSYSNRSTGHLEQYLLLLRKVSM